MSDFQVPPTSYRLLDTFLCLIFSPSSRNIQPFAHQTSPPGDLRDIPNHHAQNRTPELSLKLGPHRLPISGTATPSSQFLQLKYSSLSLISYLSSSLSTCVSFKSSGLEGHHPYHFQCHHPHTNHHCPLPTIVFLEVCLPQPQSLLLTQ